MRLFEFGYSSDEAWRKIRAMRATPPSKMPRSRAKLFVSALEQAEQQFAAAASIGYESRAVNLYYGLSQAGRAIAAAFTPDRVRVSPEVSGHGLDVDLSRTRAADIFGLRIRGEGGRDTSYGRLAWLLNSDPLQEPIALAAIWNMVREVCLDDPQPDYPVPMSVGKIYGPAPRVVDPDRFTVPLTYEDAENGGARLKERYPGLMPARLVARTGRGQQIHDDGTTTELATFEYDDYSNKLPSYRGSPVLMPACAPSGKPLDPLLAWWVLLYTLSMITRYKPVAWTGAINVNQSVLAVPLETALSKALDAVPAQIMTVLARPIAPPDEHTDTHGADGSRAVPTSHG